MSDILEDVMKNMIYISYKDLSPQEFIKKVFTTFSMHMPVSNASLFEFKNNMFIKFAAFTYNENIFHSPDKVVLHKELLHDLIVHFYSADSRFKSQIFSDEADGVKGDVFKIMYRKPGTSIYIPIIFDISLDLCFFISLYSPGKNSYTEEHLALCDAACAPLGMAAKDIIVRGDQKPGRKKQQSSSSKKTTPPYSEEQTNDSTTFVPFNQYVSEYIRAAIRHANGRISGKNGAAALLGLPPTTLWSKMRSLNITNVKIPYIKNK